MVHISQDNHGNRIGEWVIEESKRNPKTETTRNQVMIAIIDNAKTPGVDLLNKTLEDDLWSLFDKGVLALNLPIPLDKRRVEFSHMLREIMSSMSDSEYARAGDNWRDYIKNRDE